MALHDADWVISPLEVELFPLPLKHREMELHIENTIENQEQLEVVNHLIATVRLANAATAQGLSHWKLRSISEGLECSDFYKTITMGFGGSHFWVVRNSGGRLLSVTNQEES